MDEKTLEQIRLNEKQFVEEPFLEELDKLGWKIVRLDNEQTPKDTGRENFAEVVLIPELRKSLKKINDWLEDDQIDEVVKRITHIPKSGLMEANQQVLELLLENTSVSENRKTKEKSPTVKYIDFKRSQNNSFIAISQFKVRILGTEHHIYPDVTLFLNGLPVVVIECKSPKTKEPIAEAIDQLLRYSEQRGEKSEGNKALFFYNQFVVATYRNECEFGTISTHIEKYFFRWTDPYPKTLDQISKSKTPNDQQRLIHGMLDFSNLLNLIQLYTIYTEDEKGKTIKVVARYQQFRAVKLIIKRLIEGKNRRERGGIVWHTQGSGKSLTMMFTVREMYSHPKLKDWKVVFLTDRTQLEDQLGKTSRHIGFKVNVAESISKLKQLLRTTSSDLVMAMMHKFQERDLKEVFPELNTSPKILVMADEAHRTQYKLLAANLEKALPDATEIAFTGTPTDKTEKKYKDYIDKYTMRQSINDGVTLEIVYEGRTLNAEVDDKKAMDKEFEDVFSEYSLKERLQALGYGSREAYLEAKGIIAAKAKDLIHHYVTQVFPNGFKAQIVATSREAAARYKDAVDDALKNEIAQLEKENPYLINVEQLKRLKTAVIISRGDQNEKTHLKKYSDTEQHKKDIASFKLAFGAESEGIKGDVGILIVNNMLLTGFDAPIEQVMYLDQVIRAHNLLQAVARVNRVAGEEKEKGFIVDYVGVGHHLKEAIDNFEEREKNEILDCFENEQDELNALVSAHKKIYEFIKKQGVKNLNDYDTFYDLFYDEDIRFEFIVLFKEFARALDIVFPRKEALDFLPDFKHFSEIYIMAAKHLRDGRMSMKGIPDKLRKIADAHLISKGIDQKVAPISIIDEKFQENIEKIKRTRTKAAEIEHAVRHYIGEHADEDPELYASFSEMLAEIFQNFKDNWDIIYQKLEELRAKMKNTEKEPTYGLHRKKQMPFFRIFKKEIFDNKDLSDDQIAALVNLIQIIFLEIETELKLPDFWDNTPAKNRLKGELNEILLSKEFKDLPNVVKRRNAIASRIMEIAKTNNDIILYAQ